MSIRDMEMLGIGKPNDVGGTETEGTVMAKENAILEMLNDYKSKVKSNKILKQTPTKTVVVPSNLRATIEFEFEKPVKILGLYFNVSGGSGYGAFPVYIINGENSFTTEIYCAGGLTIPAYLSNNKFGFRSYRTSITDDIPVPIFDIYATKLVFHASVHTSDIGEDIQSYVIYQEEG